MAKSTIFYVNATCTAEKLEIIIRGGSCQTLYTRAAGNTTVVNVTAEPWVNVTAHDNNGAPKTFTTPNFFAISTSNTVSGTYNYELGHSWELTLDQMLTCRIPDDQTYYLFGRYLDGAYQPLNLRYATPTAVGNMSTWVKYQNAGGNAFKVSSTLYGDVGYAAENVITEKRYLKNANDDCELRFNSGDNEILYLCFNACALDDNSGTYNFVFNNIELLPTQNIWVAA